MIFTETRLKGAYIVDIKKLEDERGFFARSFCQHEFEQVGFTPHFVQCNISFNKINGTLRGMHYQSPPFEEAKLVRCTHGQIYDVIIDLRANSPTFLQWEGVILNQENYRMLYIPKGFAHGFLTQADNTEVFYQMSEFYAPECAQGVRWDDPLFGINWPGKILCMSAKDQAYPNADPLSIALK